MKTVVHLDLGILPRTAIIRHGRGYSDGGEDVFQRPLEIENTTVADVITTCEEENISTIEIYSIEW